MNRSDRVHGCFVNSEDVFYYAGDTTALNQFLVGFAAIKNTSLIISIRRSLTHASSPWDKRTRETVANWRLYCVPYDVDLLDKTLQARAETRDTDAIHVRLKEIMGGPKVARLQIRIGGDVELDKLTIPGNIELTLIDKHKKASQTIEDFVVQHERLRSKQLNQRLDRNANQEAHHRRMQQSSDW